MGLNFCGSGVYAPLIGFFPQKNCGKRIGAGGRFITCVCKNSTPENVCGRQQFKPVYESILCGFCAHNTLGFVSNFNLVRFHFDSLDFGFAYRKSNFKFQFPISKSNFKFQIQIWSGIPINRAAFKPGTKRVRAGRVWVRTTAQGSVTGALRKRTGKAMR